MSWLTEADLSEVGFKYLGKNVRISSKAIIHGASEISIGDNSRVDDLCILSGNIQIGRNVHIAVMCNVAGGEAGVIFEDFSGLAYACQVFSQSDDYSGKTLTNPTVPDRYKSEKKSAVRLCRHVIVGTQSVVLPGVTIAEGCAIGAMSLVRKSTEPWGIYMGNPAKRIKSRSKSLLDLEALYVQQSNN